MQRRTLLKRIGVGGTAAAGIGAVSGETPTVESIVAGEFDERDWMVTIDGDSVALEQFVSRVDDPVARLREAGVTVVGGCVTADRCCDSCEMDCLCTIC